MLNLWTITSRWLLPQSLPTGHEGVEPQSGITTSHTHTHTHITHTYKHSQTKNTPTHTSITRRSNIDHLTVLPMLPGERGGREDGPSEARLDPTHAPLMEQKHHRLWDDGRNTTTETPQQKHHTRNTTTKTPQTLGRQQKHHNRNTTTGGA